MSESDLKEIRDGFQYAVDSWRDIYKDGDEDMRYVIGDPWPTEEKRMRKESGRPCLSLDELSQYINQRINDVRQNKRAIKLSPAGEGADDKTAELRADIIRTIERKGGLQAYITGYENAIQRGFGFWGVGKRYVSEESFEQELFIRRFPNPKAVYIDPDAKEAACGDMRYAYVVEDIPKKQFKQRFPGAATKDFPSEMINQYPLWIKDETIQLCEAWKMKVKPSKLFLLRNPADNQLLHIFKRELPKEASIESDWIIFPSGLRFEILKERDSERREIIKQLVNGIEILEQTEWEGKYIPIIPVFGSEYWVDTGAGSKRVLHSLVRKAEAAAMLHNYIATAKIEAIGQVLKAPYIGFEGTIEGHEEEWKWANRKPLTMLLVKPILDPTGTALLPPPQRNQWEPQIQGYEIVDESAKRSIQNAMGMYNASVGRQDTQAKSGVAIEKLDVQSDQGNYHYIDHFDEAIIQTGRILDNMIPKVYDTPRDLLISKADETQAAVRVNEPVTENGVQTVHSTTRGRYEATISVGPSYQSQRQLASDFVDLLVQNLGTLPIQPEVKPKLLAMSITLKQLGPIGDQMVEMLNPKEDEDAGMLRQKLEQMQQVTQVLTQQVNQLVEEQQSKIRELESKEAVAGMETAAKLEMERMKQRGAMEIERMKANLAQLQTHLGGLIDATKGQGGPLRQPQAQGMQPSLKSVM